MTHTRAELDANGVVINIAVFEDGASVDSNWVVCGENDFVVVGGDWVAGVFYPPQPYPSWTRQDGKWVSPVPYPDSGDFYVWNESNQGWDKP